MENVIFLNNGDIWKRRIDYMKKLLGKNVLVTGSSSGIGKSIALLFADEGANVIMCSNKSTDKGYQVLSDVRKKGVYAEYYSADLCKEKDIEKLFSQIKQKFGYLDVLINNAGRTYNIGFEDLTQESLLRDLQTNLTSSILCSKYAIELMEKEHGWIVNTSSIRGIDYSGRAGIIGYCASKAGINSFTKTLAAKLAPKIFVNAVAPGFVDTGYMDSMDNQTLENWLKDIPINRFIKPSEIAEVYLLLSTSKIFSGSILIPDGGYSLLNR